MMIELKAGQNDSNRRLDRVLRKALPNFSLSFIHRLLRQGKVLVDGNPAGKGFRIQAGSTITIQSGDVNVKTGGVNVHAEDPDTLPSLPEILWRGSGIIVFNKPPGLETHGPAGLDRIARVYLAEKTTPSLSFRPGPLHRLDKQASGAVAFSETIEGARLFSLLLRERKIEKIYLALVEGRLDTELHWRDDLVRDTNVKKTFTVNEYIAAPPEYQPEHHQQKPFNMKKKKTALTSVKPLVGNNGYTLAEVRIVTGRTHQIRVQAASHAFPLAGDVKYGGRRIPGIENGGFFLHAWKIAFGEDSGVFPRHITAPIPETFTLAIKTVFGY